MVLEFFLFSYYSSFFYLIIFFFQFQECYEAFKNRGPDAYQELNEDISPYTILQFAGSVLWTQGSSPVPQPIVDEDGNILLWNGDIFAGPLVSGQMYNSNQKVIIVII